MTKYFVKWDKWDKPTDNVSGGMIRGDEVGKEMSDKRRVVEFYGTNFTV